MMADMLGYMASVAVLATFLARTMVPLRLIAILSNVLFILYGYAADIRPVLLLHLILLPINIFRLSGWATAQPDAIKASIQQRSNVCENCALVEKERFGTLSRP